MPPKQPTTPQPSSSNGGGLARLGFSFAASANQSKKSLFDSDDEIVSTTTKTPTKTTLSATTTATMAASTPQKTTNSITTPIKPTPSATTITSPTPQTPAKTLIKSLYARKVPIGTPSSGVQSTPVKQQFPSKPDQEVGPGTTVPPTSAVKHPRPTSQDSDDEVIIKRASTTLPSAPQLSTPIKRTNYGQNQDKSTSNTPTTATVTTPTSTTSQKKSKFQSSEDDWDATSSAGDDNDSSDDYSSDSESDSGNSSFVSESDTDKKPKKRISGAQSAKKTPTLRKNNIKSAPSMSMDDVSAFTDDDNDDGVNVESARIVPTTTATTDLPIARTSKPLNIDSFINSGRPVVSNFNTNSTTTTTTTTTTSSSSDLTRSFADTNFNDDSDSDSPGESPQPSQSKSNQPNSNQQNIGGVSTLSSAVGDYELPNFVLPQNIKDKQGRRPDHPEYDPRTVLIPQSAMKDMSPAQKQFWEIKQDNMDVVLLFKVGKFYELFDLDAEVGMKELNLSRMGTDKRLHAGFPEMGYAKYATVLVEKGYRVACAEQMQTPQQLQEYNQSLPSRTPKQKVVNRQIWSFVTPGTGVTDEFLTKPSSYLLAIVECPLTDTQHTTVNAGGDVTFNRVSYNDRDVVYGVSYVDTSTGAFTVGSFIDSTSKTSLRALLAQVRPSEILYYRSSFTPQTDNIIQTEVPPNCLHTPVPSQQKIKSDNCVAKLGQYFKPYSAQNNRRQQPGAPNQTKRINPKKIDLVTGWPNVLHQWKSKLIDLDNDDENSAGQNNQYTLPERTSLVQSFWESLGLLYAYLQRTLLDKELIPLCRFNEYKPVEFAPVAQSQFTTTAMADSITVPTTTTTTSTTDQTKGQKTTNLPVLPNFHSDNDNLILDSQTLTNLEILINADGELDGTLLKYLDNCQTLFGKRALRKWICAPLFRPTDINNRLDAVEELLDQYDIVKTVSSKFKRVPDLERQLSRIRANSIKKDVEAVMYGDIGKVRVDLFLKCLEGFEAAMEAVQDFMRHNWRSGLLQALLFKPENDTSPEDDEQPEQNLFEQVQQLLVEFRDAFDHKQARQNGNITPKPGVVEEYDDANNELTKIETDLADLLKRYRGMFGHSNQVIWIHKNKETHQLEIPIDLLNKYPNSITNIFEQASSTSKVRRFYTPEIKTKAKEYDAAVAKREAVLKDVTRQVFEKFSMDYHIWSSAVDSISYIDCLLSLATASRQYGGGSNQSCRPTVLDVSESPTQKPLLKLRNSIHPTVAHSSLAAYKNAPKTYIPNDVDVGTDENPSQFVIVSGPNMGGKSTLLRQVCCCIILAQIGCFVPAEEMVLTPIDRIFTRVGASDRLLQGQSTFLVELEETAHILRHATPRSFVILDELGRGTSTFDGTAIAHSVVQFLSQRIQCLTLFTTHYHMLLQEYKNNPLVAMYHMAYKFHTDQDPKPDELTATKKPIQNIHFLYKFQKGICNKSFGLHVATLAKLPGMVIDIAYERGEWFSSSFEQTDTKYNKMLKRFIVAMYHNDTNTLRMIQEEFQHDSANMIQ